MSRVIIMCLLCTMISAMSFGCARASIEEARYVLERSPDFQTELATTEVAPDMKRDIPFVWAGNKVDANRIFLFENKSHQICVALMDSARPPTMVLKQCYSHKCPVEATPLPQVTNPPAPECNGLNYRVVNPERGP